MQKTTPDEFLTATLLIAAVQAATPMTTVLLRLIPAFLTIAALGLPSAFAQTTERVSVDSLGVQGNAISAGSAITADGRYVAFSSFANNLVAGDTNNASDIFVHDRLMDQTTRVSMDSLGVQGNNGSYDPGISANGRYVAFHSDATDLVPGDTNDDEDVFVHDRQTGQTFRVSVNSNGVQGNSISSGSSISADGRYVAFTSDATNLVPGDTNGWRDIFVHDRQTGQTKRVSVSSLGVQGNNSSDGPAISVDGRYVAFDSYANNLVPGDTNGWRDIFVYDRQTGQTTSVSVSSGGMQGNGHSLQPSISADGRYVACTSYANNLVPGDTNTVEDIFVHDRQMGQTTRVSVDSSGVQGNFRSDHPAISTDGRLVAFRSFAQNLVPGDTNNKHDIFVHDLQIGQTTRVSKNSGGGEGNLDSAAPVISATDRFVAFDSLADNLVFGDTNNHADIFVHDRGVTEPTLTRVGNCPGAITLTMTGATAGGDVVFACGPAGAFVRPAPPCLGLVLGVTPPASTAVRTADGLGTAIFQFHASLALCGRSLQGVDTASCTASNVIVL